MRGVLVFAALTTLAAGCDTKKLGVEGATCSASSDCAGELQCIKATCVPLRAGAPAPVEPEPAQEAARAAPVPVPPVPAVPTPESTRVSLPPVAGTGQDLPPVKEVPADPAAPATGSTASPPAEVFRAPYDWAGAVKAGDPWATSVMKVLQGVRIGTYGAQMASAEYKFRLTICQDGTLKPERKKSTGDAALDNAIHNALEQLKVPVPDQVRKVLAGGCKRIPHEFTYRTKDGLVR